MKKTISLLNRTTLVFLLLFCLGGLTGCTNENELNVPTQIACDINYSETEAYQLFLASVDSLNSLYPRYETKGSFIRGAGTSMADYAGHTYGGAIGRWIGGAIGVLTGNPAGTVAGVMIGDCAGRFICGALASGLANMLLSCQAIDASHGELQLKCNLAFENVLEEDTDSLGYYHNLCMVKILTQKERYNYGKNINKELLYDDIIEFYKSFDIYDAALAKNLDVKNAVIMVTTDLCEPAIQYELGKLSEDDLINHYVDLLKAETKCNDLEVKQFRDFGSKLVFKCATLNEQELVNYASDMNNLIINSSLPISEKINLSSSSDLIINSSLCWQQ